MPTLEQVLERYPKEVRVVELNYPLARHKQSKPAAAAAIAAGKQGKFWEMHDLLFDNYNKINEQLITRLATNVGLDMKRFESDMKSSEVAKQIDRDLMQGKMHGVSGTPTLFVNGKRLEDRSLNGITVAIDRALGREHTALSGDSSQHKIKAGPAVNAECGG